MTDPGNISVWQSRNLLRFHCETKEQALNSFWNFCDWLWDHRDHSSSAFRFFFKFGPATDDVRYLQGEDITWLEDEVRQEAKNEFSIPLYLLIVAPTKEIAVPRLRHIESLIEALIRDGYQRIIRDELVEIVPSVSVEPSGSQNIPDPIESDPDQTNANPFDDLRGILFPSADAWFDMNDTGDPLDKSISTVKAMDEWLFLNPGTDDLNEAITSVEIVSRLLPDVLTNTQLWNWVVISVHHALQGFMALNLAGTDRERLIMLADAISFENWKVKNPKGGTPPKRRSLNSRSTGRIRRAEDFQLPFFKVLYRGIQMDAFMLQFVDSTVFTPNATSDEVIEKLDWIRNDFVHFHPNQSVYHDNLSFPDMIAECIRILRFLAFESNNLAWHKAKHRQRLENAFASIDETLERIRERYYRAKLVMGHNPTRDSADA